MSEQTDISDAQLAQLARDARAASEPERISSAPLDAIVRRGHRARRRRRAGIAVSASAIVALAVTGGWMALSSGEPGSIEPAVDPTTDHIAEMSLRHCDQQISASTDFFEGVPTHSSPLEAVEDRLAHRADRIAPHPITAPELVEVSQSDHRATVEVWQDGEPVVSFLLEDVGTDEWLATEHTVCAPS